MIFNHCGTPFVSCIFPMMQIFQMLEFPDEEDRMTTLQELVIYEREGFLKTIYNLTSGLNADQFEALKSYIFYGPDFDADYDVRTIMLNTNRVQNPTSYASQVFLSNLAIKKLLSF